MPVDYLSRLPGAKDTIASISAFDPFQAEIQTANAKRSFTNAPDLQDQEPMATIPLKTGSGLLQNTS
jgi:hypothetical protein